MALRSQTGGMSGLLPSEPDIDDDDGEPRVVGVDSEDADELLAALSSGTARKLIATLHETPSTPSELADAVGTSLQNVQYHLEKFEDANLVEVRGSRYSEKGREMSIYGPTDRPLVLFAGTEDQTRSVKSALASLLGGVGVLGVASLLVQQLVGGGVQAPTTGGESGAGAIASQPAHTTVAAQGAQVAEATRTTTQQAAAMGAESVTTTAAAGGQLHAQSLQTAAAQGAGAAGLPPGLLFFLGGLLVLLLGAGLWYRRSR